MGWMDSRKYFCMFSETLTDVANAPVHTMLPVPGYEAISNFPETGPGPLYTLDSLTHIYCYMDDVITAFQGVPELQRQVFDGNVRALKWIFLLLSVEAKGSVSAKKLRAREGGYTYVKEVLRWTINTESVMVTLPERKLQELDQLLAIPLTQQHIGRK